jgi:hypothetical protein
MLSSGGQYCYAYDKVADLKGSKFWSTCTAAKQYGCCPSNLTEDHFWRHPQEYQHHPPTLLVQSYLDNDADWVCTAVSWPASESRACACCCRYQPDLTRSDIMCGAAAWIVSLCCICSRHFRRDTVRGAILSRDDARERRYEHALCRRWIEPQHQPGDLWRGRVVGVEPAGARCPRCRRATRCGGVRVPGAGGRGSPHWRQ